MTIWMLYTAWALLIATGLLWRLVRGPRCAHDWEPVVERELPSVVEVVGQDQVGRYQHAPGIHNAGRKKFFALVSCKRCGWLQKFETLSGADWE
jgi:hypothetical protein